MRGVIGPERMDYSKVVSVLSYVGKTLKRIANEVIMTKKKNEDLSCQKTEVKQEQVQDIESKEEAQKKTSISLGTSKVRGGRRQGPSAKTASGI